MSIVSILYLIFIYSILILHLLFMFWIGFYFITSLVAEFLASGVPFVPTYNSDIKTMKEKLELIPGKTMIDLGCGNGKALKVFTDHFHISEAHGYDFNVWAILWWKFMNRITKSKTIKLFVWDFLKVDISRFDYVYIYLLTKYLAKIEDHVFEHIWDHTIIISNSFQFKKHTPFQIIKNDEWKERFFLYRKSDSDIITEPIEM